MSSNPVTETDSQTQKEIVEGLDPPEILRPLEPQHVGTKHREFDTVASKVERDVDEDIEDAANPSQASSESKDSIESWTDA